MLPIDRPHLGVELMRAVATHQLCCIIATAIDISTRRTEYFCNGLFLWIGVLAEYIRTKKWNGFPTRRSYLFYPKVIKNRNLLPCIRVNSFVVMGNLRFYVGLNFSKYTL